MRGPSLDVVQDTLVGLFGAALIVASMVATIQYQDAGAQGENQVEAPPPSIGESIWRASGCQAASLYWTPSLDALGDVVGPNYEPAPGPLPDRGLFWLFAFECRSSNVDGLRISPPSGAAAIVAIEEPDDTRNVSAPDGWAAIPSWYSPKGPVYDTFDEHGFNATEGQAAVGVSSTPLSDSVRMMIDSPTGALEASLTVTGPTTERSVEGALVGTDPDLFSVFHGPERMDRRTNGTSTIETRGTTWVERLNLSPTPYKIAYDTGMSWNFTFQHEPWNASEGDSSASLIGSQGAGDVEEPWTEQAVADLLAHRSG